ncbi:UTRA domain-containing protein, partial [Cribrihabitans sp. XS_ASV171]
VQVYDGVSLVDEEPIAVFQSVFPGDRLPGLLEALRETQSVTAALRRCGVADYTRASTRITARAATPAQALQLRLSEGAPLIRTTGINVDPDGVPVEYGRSWFAGDRVTLTLDGEEN